MLLKPYIDLIFRASCEEILSSVFLRTLLRYEESNSSRFILIQLTKKRIIGHHMQLIELVVHLVYVDHKYLNSIMLLLKVSLLRIQKGFMVPCSN